VIKKNYILALLLSLLIFDQGKAQHYQFSQFYAAPTYLNPAFTGANVCSRISINYRNQWNTIPGGFTTYQVTADHSLKKLNSGIGLQFFNDKAGVGGLRTTQINLLYAYDIRINKTYGARAGLSFGGVQRSIDYSSLVFGDQIARGGSSTTVDDISIQRKFYVDMAAGGLFYNSTWWVGLAANHLNRPNQSLQGNESALPLELKLHGGYKFIFDGDESNGTKKNPNRNNIIVTANYKKQAKFNQLDLGLYYSKNYIVMGVWYRGLPFFKPVPDYRNNDAMVFIVGLSVEKFRVGYSYDVTISKLTNPSSGGTHEISIAYQFCDQKRKKKKNILISCPKF
jgi:type IX secretion system PorP/SprF family membrane protein